MNRVNSQARVGLNNKGCVHKSKLTKGESRISCCTLFVGVVGTLGDDSSSSAFVKVFEIDGIMSAPAKAFNILIPTPAISVCTATSCFPTFLDGVTVGVFGLLPGTFGVDGRCIVGVLGLTTDEGELEGNGADCLFAFFGVLSSSTAFIPVLDALRLFG